MILKQSVMLGDIVCHPLWCVHCVSRAPSSQTQSNSSVIPVQMVKLLSLQAHSTKLHVLVGT